MLVDFKNITIVFLELRVVFTVTEYLIWSRNYNFKLISLINKLFLLNTKNFQCLYLELHGKLEYIVYLR